MRFDFALSAAQEARAGQLHRDTIVFDMLSQHVGGNIFTHYPEDLQVQFRESSSQAGGGFAVLQHVL